MVSNAIKTCILLVSAIALADVATAVQTSIGCSGLAAKHGVNITYEDVATCYDSIPFNQAAAKSTIDIVTALFNDYYISRDSAMTPFLAKPLQGDPVDIVQKLRKIARTKYTSDRKFHTDVYYALASLYDYHVQYSPYCYGVYTYVQPLNLYAPVINGKQALKVYSDIFNRGYEDCTVVKIDGKNGMVQVKKFSETLHTSKDPNARLNEALAGMIYNPQAGGTFVSTPGQFSARYILPDGPSVQYELQCANSKTNIVVNDNWIIAPQLPAAFTDTASYINNVCLATPENTSNPGASAVLKRDLGSAQRSHRGVLASGSYQPEAAAAKPNTPAGASPTPPVYPEAIKIGAGNCTVFYQLKDRPTIGIVNLFVTLLDFAEIDFMYQSLETLYQNGVTEIIIDVVGGDGGYAGVGADFAQLFFPQTSNLDTNLHVDFRSNPKIQQLSAKVFNTTTGGSALLGNMFDGSGGGIYDSSRFFNLDTNQVYTNNSFYLDTVSQYRNGRQAVYTKRVAFKPATYPVRPNLAKYPWTNNPDRLRIVTDGRCLSACSHVANILANKYKVKSYGIGGTTGEPLSKYEGAVGMGMVLDLLNSIYASANMSSGIASMPYQGVLTYSAGELHASPESTVPLEFDAPQYPTDFRLDFDPVNARSREALWTQVAKAAWN